MSITWKPLAMFQDYTVCIMVVSAQFQYTYLVHTSSSYLHDVSFGFAGAFLTYR